MRIIAGQRRGHKIDGPKSSASTKPTSDFVRESLFNILGDLVAGREAVDLFAGTGALGLEALSRGARRAIFVERDRENVGLILRNIATLRYEDRASVRHADAYRWARSFEPAEPQPLLIFLDPPYREFEIHPRFLNLMLKRLLEKLPPDSVIALEAGRILDDRILPDFEKWDIRRYGNTRIALRMLSASAPIPDAQNGSAGSSPGDGPPGALEAEDRSDD